MEISGTVFRALPSFIGAKIEAHSNSLSKPSLSFGSFDVMILGSRRRIAKLPSSCGFSDKGHIQYYSDPTRGIRCRSGKIDHAIKSMHKSMSKEKKKVLMKNKKRNRLEMVKGLSGDLSLFSDLDLGLDNHGLVDPVRAKMEATKLLLGHMQKLKTEERKEEKGKMKDAARMQKRLECELSSSSSSFSSSSSSSSSSSESSDSECDEVVDMSSLKSKANLTPPAVPVAKAKAALELQNMLTHEAVSVVELPQLVGHEAHSTLTIPSTVNQKGASTDNSGLVIGSCFPCSDQPCFTTRTSTSSNCNNVGIMAGGSSSSSSVKKVEVCMGGKCKKSGAAALLDEFQRVLGAEGGSVVGCKCMGKCKDGPNVRIMNHSKAEFVDDPVRIPTSGPLCDLHPIH